MKIFSEALIKQLLVTCGASMCFFIIGLVRGYSSSAIPSIERHQTNLIETTDQKSWIGAIPPLGAFLGSISSGFLMEKIGRKRTLMFATPLWCVSWLLLGFAQNLFTLLAGRIATGFCVGLVLAPVQVYIGECCDALIRGRLGSMPTISMSFGILVSYVFGYSLYWRYLAFIDAGLSLVAFIVLIPLPESPVWLESHDKDGGSVARKWLALKETNQTPLEKQEVFESLFTRKVFFSSSVLKPLGVGFGLLILQQISGIDSIIFFTVEIFKTSGSNLEPSAAAICIGAVQLVCGIASVSIVDKAGRRPLLLVSTASCALAMCGLGFAYYFPHREYGSWLGYLPIASLVTFMIGFSIGLAGIPFLLLGELFPVHYRSQLSAGASSINLLTMFSVIKSYHIFETHITPAGTFWLYSCCCGLGFIFVLSCVPETKGKTLAEIERQFAKSSKINKEVYSFKDSSKV